jgi:hypothetical protein
VSADGPVVRAVVQGLVRAGARLIELKLEDDGSVSLKADGEVVLRGIDLWALRASIGDWRKDH